MPEKKQLKELLNNRRNLNNDNEELSRDGCFFLQTKLDSDKNLVRPHIFRGIVRDLPNIEKHPNPR